VKRWFVDVQHLTLTNTAGNAGSVFDTPVDYKEAGHERWRRPIDGHVHTITTLGGRAASVQASYHDIVWFCLRDQRLNFHVRQFINTLVLTLLTSNHTANAFISSFPTFLHCKATSARDARPLIDKKPSYRWQPTRCLYKGRAVFVYGFCSARLFNTWQSVSVPKVPKLILIVCYYYLLGKRQKYINIPNTQQ